MANIPGQVPHTATRAIGGDDAAAALPTSGIVLLLILSVAWGSTFPAMKVVLGEVPVLTFRAICLSFGGLSLAAIALSGGRSLSVPRRHWRWLALCTLFNVIIWHLLTAYALTMLPAGRAVIIGYMMPLWVVLLATLFLGEPFTLSKLAGLVLGFAGLGVLVGPDWAAMQSAPLGVGLMVAASFSWGLGTVLLKSVDWQIPTTSLAAWQLGLGAVPISIGAVAFDPTDWSLSGETWLAFAYVLLGAMLFCQWAWFSVVRLLPSSIAALGSLPIPVIGVVVGAVWLGEPVGWPELGALVLVCAGLASVLLPPALQARRLRSEQRAAESLDDAGAAGPHPGT